MRTLYWMQYTNEFLHVDLTTTTVYDDHPAGERARAYYATLPARAPWRDSLWDELYGGARYERVVESD